MAILNIITESVGLVGVTPSNAYIATNNTEAEILATGFLNQAVQNGTSFQMPCLAIVSTKETPSSPYVVGTYQVSHSGTNWSLIPAGSPGDVVLPTVANRLAHATNATGTLSTDAASVTNAGNIAAGLSGTAGYLASFPATAARGSLRLVGANSAGDTVTQITNASQAAARVYSIPDGGQAASNFLLTDNAGTQTIATGSLSLTLGNITAAAGNIAATLGSVTGGTGVTATTGNVTASAGNVVAGATAAAGTVTSFSGTGANEFLRLAAINNTAGDFSTTVSNASSIGQSQTISIPDAGAATANFLLSSTVGTSQSIASDLVVTGGFIQSGDSGSAGTFVSYPATAANGQLIVAAVNAGADFDTTISNAASVGQDQVISIPDSGAATASFLLSTGADNILAQQEFVGISEVLTFGTGTWTVTRLAQGNYVSRHTPANETSIIGIDLTPMIRTAASKGFRLDSFDLVYAIAANPLDAHSAVLDRIAYADNVAVSVTSVPITATLATATQANPYVTNCTVTTPAFDNTADSKYVLEVTVDNAAASEYDFYGVMLRFSQTIA